jgi:hypothetical protein
VLSIKKCTHFLAAFSSICVKSCHAISVQNGPLVTRRDGNHGDEERARFGEVDVSGVLEHPDRAGDTAM